MWQSPKPQNEATESDPAITIRQACIFIHPESCSHASAIAPAVRFRKSTVMRRDCLYDFASVMQNLTEISTECMELIDEICLRQP